jgi:hypothetical protein
MCRWTTQPPHVRVPYFGARCDACAASHDGEPTAAEAVASWNLIASSRRERRTTDPRVDAAACAIVAVLEEGRDDPRTLEQWPQDGRAASVAHEQHTVSADDIRAWAEAALRAGDAERFEAKVSETERRIEETRARIRAGAHPDAPKGRFKL